MIDMYRIDAAGIHYPSLDAVKDRLAKDIATDLDGKIRASLIKMGWTPPPKPDPESAMGMHGVEIANLAARIAELEAAIRHARVMADHGVHGEMGAVEACDEIHRTLSAVVSSK